MKKAIKTKPQFYAMMLPELQRLAIENGYNLIVHGSLSRDMDLVAIPWVDEPSTHLELLQTLDKFINGSHKSILDSYLYSMLPGGRYSYVINIYRNNESYQDQEFYLDISITPLLK